MEPIQATQKSKVTAYGKDHLNSNQSTVEFQKIFNREKEKLKISNHAQKRLNQKDVELNAHDYQQLDAAVNELAQKGSKESLLVYKDLGFITNIANRTIITAIAMEELHTVTNIDSAKFIQ